jgi:hypothetical protein
VGTVKRTAFILPSTGVCRVAEQGSLRPYALSRTVEDRTTPEEPDPADLDDRRPDVRIVQQDSFADSRTDRRSVRRQGEIHGAIHRIGVNPHARQYVHG